MDIQIPAKQYIATRAAIIKDGKLLIIRQSAEYAKGKKVGQYDLPGGKIELGESFAEGLKREVREEAGLDVEIGKPFYVGEWRPVVKDQILQIIGIFFVCASSDKKVLLSADHDDFQWIGAGDINKFPLMDPVPEAVEILIKERIIF